MLKAILANYLASIHTTAQEMRSVYPIDAIVEAQTKEHRLRALHGFFTWTPLSH
jgi:hypothetical protein